MPLARIITQVPEYSIPLIHELLSRGFDIQTSRPDQENLPKADLEITVLQCSPEEVAAVAADASLNRDMCVFVSAANRAGRSRSIEVVLLKPRDEEDQGAVTMAEVIDISSALVRKRAGADQTAKAPKAKGPELVGTGTAESRQSSWAQRWEAGTSAFAASLRKSTTSTRRFLVEVTQETGRLCQCMADFVIASGERLRRDLKARAEAKADAGQDLVPSMFGLFSEPTQSPTVDEVQRGEVRSPWARLKQIPLMAVLRTRAFRRIAVPAGLAACAALILMSLLARDDSAAVQPAQSVQDVATTTTTTKGGENADPKLTNSAIKPAALVPPVHVKRTFPPVEDTVVRYQSQPQKTAPLSAFQVKHYSDMD